MLNHLKVVGSLNASGKSRSLVWRQFQNKASCISPPLFAARRMGNTPSVPHPFHERHSPVKCARPAPKDFFLPFFRKDCSFPSLLGAGSRCRAPAWAGSSRSAHLSIRAGFGRTACRASIFILARGAYREINQPDPFFRSPGQGALPGRADAAHDLVRCGRPIYAEV